MSEKLTIRRVGTHLPTICLVGFLFLCISVSWLSFVGLPDSLLRKIETIAADRGVPIEVEAIRLNPTRGLALKADKLKIYAAKGETEPLVTARSLAAGISAFRLLTGNVVLSSVRLKDGQLRIPVPDKAGQYINIDNIEFEARKNYSDDIRITSATFEVEKMKIRLSGDILHSPQEEVQQAPQDIQQEINEDPAPIDIPALLQEQAEYITKAHKIFSRQGWTEQNAPELHIHFTKGDKLSATINGAVPSYNYDIFHFRNAEVDLAYADDIFTINRLRFQTVDPISEATLQGAYAWQTREVGFNIESNAALIPMTIKLLGRDKVGILNKFSHAPDRAPDIRLRGKISFEPDFSLHNISVTGELEQRELFVDDIRIDELTLGFFYHNGNFNLHELRAQFGANQLSITATANKGEGHALIAADINVEQSLALINKLIATPITLPEDITTGERVQLKLSAKLTTPSFEPGQTDWQDFTPGLKDLSLSLKTDNLNIQGNKLVNPDISLTLNNISQTENLLPTGAEKVTFNANIKQLDASSLQASKINLAVKAEQVKYENNHLSIAQASIGSNEGTALAELLSVGELQLRQTGMQLSFSELNIENEIPTIDAISTRLTAEGINHGELELSEVVLEVNELTHLTPLADSIAEKFSKANLALASKNITYEGRNMGHLSMSAHLAEGQTGDARLSFEAISGEGDSTIDNIVSTKIDWHDISRPTFDDIRLELAPTSFGDILKHFKIKIPHIKLPEKLSARGNVTINAEAGRPELMNFKINIPQLIRTPFNVVPFRGEEIPLAIKADVQVIPDDTQNSYSYTVDLNAAHETGTFEGKVKGNTAGLVLVTGANTIRTDIANRLIDNYVAHSIMRDFRFGPTGRNVITDIDVKVKYDEGISVDSFCNVNLYDTDYQLSVIANDQHGNEFVRKELGPNPYTLTKHGKCYVRSKVRYGVTENGKPVEDECVVTIGDITMLFDNEPWFKKQDFSGVGLSKKTLNDIRKRYRNTTMKGDAVIIDVEHSFVELVNIRGEVYPAYSLGMFYDPIQYFMADIVLPYPAKVETRSCVFPIYHDCKRPMSGLIKAKSPRACGFRFLGTTIPMRQFSGFIKIADDHVLLDKMNAKSWGGVLNAVIKIGFSGKHTSFDGNVTANNLDLKEIMASYNTEFSSALCNGHIRFRSPSAELKDIQGYGEVSVVNGDLMGFTLFQPIGALISDLPANLLLLENEAKSEQAGKKPGYISKALTGTGDAITHLGRQAKQIPGYNHIFAYDLQNAYAKFAIANGHLRAYDTKVTGYNLDVDMKLDVNLDTTYIRGNLWPKITSLPTILLSPVTFLSDFMIDIIIYGEPDDLQWKIGLDRLLRGKSEPNKKETSTQKKAS